MAGKEGKLALGRCTAATCEEASTKRGTLNGCTAQHKSAADGEPMEVVLREDALLKRKAEEEIYEILVAEILHKRPGAAAAGEVSDPMLVDLAKAAVPQPLAEGDSKEAVSEPHAEIGIEEAVSEPQAEDDYQDGYEDEAEDDYQDDAEYDDEAEDDYDYECDCEEEENDYEPQFLEQRDKVRALVSNFPEAAHLPLNELDKVVDRIMEQSKPEYSDLAATGKIRLLREDIELAVVPNWFYDDTPLADSIQKHEEPDRELLPLNGKSDEDQEREQFRAKVRKDLIHKGYVEVDEDYYDKKEEYERQMMQKMEEEWNQKMYLSHFRVANNEEGILYYSEEHGGYI